MTADRPSRTGRLRAWLRTTAVALFLFGLLTAVVPVWLLRWINPPITAFMAARQIEIWLDDKESGWIEKEWVYLDEMARPAQLAVMASEDQLFLEHFGFDVGALLDAVGDRVKGKRLRGASTISQQVAKNLFLWNGRSFMRKGLEAWFTIWIELFWSKERILEVYLNSAQFGPRTFGIEAAAQRYFRKSARQLTRREAALLAASLPNPARFRVDRPSPYMQRRARWIERQMQRLER